MKCFIDNHIKEKGAKGLSEALKVNTVLVTLSLNGYEKQAEGGKLFLHER